jgi:hypothetical protein
MDAEGLITAWNERQAWRMPLLIAPTIGAPRSRSGIISYGSITTPAAPRGDVDPRTLHRHRDAAVSSLILSLSRHTAYSK